MTRKVKKLARSERPPVLFMLPAVLVLIALSLFPFIYILLLSFTDYRFSSGQEISFVGFQNFGELFSDSLFTAAIKNTLVFVATVTLLEAAIGVFLSLSIYFFLSKTRKLVGIVLTLPIAMTPVAVALMWKYMLNTTYGIVNYVANEAIGVSVDWLGSQAWALVSIMVVDIWQWTPLVMLIVLAGLESIPRQSIEMAYTDGAKRFQVLRYVVLPQIKPFILVAVLLRMIDALKIFDSVYVLTEGGPGSASETLSLYGYKLGFTFLRTAYASAESLVLLAIASLLAWLLIRIFSRITWT